MEAMFIEGRFALVIFCLYPLSLTEYFLRR